MLSHASELHTAFAIEGENRTITALRQCGDLNCDAVAFVEGETRESVPGYSFSTSLDLVLLDGPHAYPLPQLEYAYLFPQIRAGGWLVIDDIQIPSVHELFRFLTRESSVVLEDVVVRTAFFRKMSAPDKGPDGWETQGINRRPVYRYCWRDELRRWLQRVDRR